MTEAEIWRAAKRVLAEFGDMAQFHAMGKELEAVEGGDMAAAAVWAEIFDVIGHMRRGKGAARPWLH